MTDVEYTEKAIEHLGNLDSQVADRVMNKVDEATDISRRDGDTGRTSYGKNSSAVLVVQ